MVCFRESSEVPIFGTKKTFDLIPMRVKNCGSFSYAFNVCHLLAPVRCSMIYRSIVGMYSVRQHSVPRPFSEYPPRCCPRFEMPTP